MISILVRPKSTVGRNEGSSLLTHFILLLPSPGFGPVFTTSDPDSFWQQLNEIHALGGGDEPEMCLSALEVCPACSPSLLLPSFPAPPPRETRTFLGPHPLPQLQSLVPLASLQGSRAILPSTLPFLALPIPLLLPFFNTSPFPPCQLALLHTPPLSDIFVFTDASPKDAFLTNRVESLTRERRCRVSMAGGRPHVSCPGVQETL